MQNLGHSTAHVHIILQFTFILHFTFWSRKSWIPTLEYIMSNSKITLLKRLWWATFITNTGAQSIVSTQIFVGKVTDQHWKKYEEGNNWNYLRNIMWSWCCQNYSADYSWLLKIPLAEGKMVVLTWKLLNS